jgi:GNAT superfamily N-acetyltransferase
MDPHVRSENQDLLKGYPKEAILKDGTGVTLRPLRPGDEPLLYALFRRLSEDELWFLNHDVSDPGLIAKWIRDLDPKRVLSVVAVLEGRIVGNAVLMRKSFGAKSHIGKIRITVDPAFREKRLGTWMLLDLINFAMMLGLEMLVMRLVQGRDEAVINGVKKLDFREEAVLRDHVLDRAGHPQNLIVLVKRLPLRWDDF